MRPKTTHISGSSARASKSSQNGGASPSDDPLTSPKAEQGEPNVKPPTLRITLPTREDEQEEINEDNPFTRELMRSVANGFVRGTRLTNLMPVLMLRNPLARNYRSRCLVIDSPGQEKALGGFSPRYQTQKAHVATTKTSIVGLLDAW